jgi:SAM-dependent methyltransferase
MDERTIDPRWYDGFFDREWLDLLAPELGGGERTEREVRFVSERLALDPGAAILDLACGHGRHSVALARLGYAVTGVDLSEPSLAHARHAAQAEGLSARFLRADMREIEFEAAFDAVVNLWSAFGYFDDQADDERVLAAVARALRPGGAFLLEQINPLMLLRRFRERFWEELESGAVMLDERRYDIATGRTKAFWTVVREDGTRVHLAHSVRLYTPVELFTMMERAGLRVEETWGSWDGDPLELDSRRLIVLARSS